LYYFKTITHGLIEYWQTPTFNLVSSTINKTCLPTTTITDQRYCSPPTNGHHQPRSTTPTTWSQRTTITNIRTSAHHVDGCWPPTAVTAHTTIIDFPPPLLHTPTTPATTQAMPRCHVTTYSKQTNTRQLNVMSRG
jgi:hypothetical protein